MVNSLDKNILNTICYFDALNYPMTVFEIWKYLIETENDNEKDQNSCTDLQSILSSLEGDHLKRFIHRKKGIFFLKGRDDLIEQRIKRDKISVSKIKKLRKTIWLLRIVPFIKMITITGRLAMKNAEYNSDWDVLIVFKNGRIWIGRTLITLILHILGKRRHHNKIKDRVCLNYFITTNSLEIKNKDLFSANEYFFCIPIFDSGRYFEKFQLKNSWIKEYKPNYCLATLGNLKAVRDTTASSILRLFLEKIFNWDILEKYLKKIEIKKIKNNPKTKHEDSLIVADDNALIFLPDPQGPKVFENFKNKVNSLGG